MLILTRRIGESLNIGDDIQVTVLGIKGTQTRIGVTAPKEVPVHREEIYERIKRERELGGLKEVWQPHKDVWPKDLASFEVFSSVEVGMAYYPDIPAEKWVRSAPGEIEGAVLVD